MSDEIVNSKPQVYLMYQPPMDMARTGHCGLLIIDGEKTHYFSMYHDMKPSEVRPLSYFEILAGLQSFSVRSYMADVIMRGQSWHTMIDLKQREDEKVSDLISGLNALSDDERQNYFARGQYAKAVRLPDGLDIEKMLAQLNRIEKEAYWVMFAPAAFRTKGPTFNCCSAIQATLEVGGVSKFERQSPVMAQWTQLPAPMKLALWVGYVAFMMMSEMTVSIENPASSVLVIPFLFLMKQVMEALVNGYLYSMDLKTMAKNPKKISLGLNAFVTMMSLVTNILAAPFNTHGSSRMFTYPVDLYRQVKAIPGSVEIDPSTMPINQPQFPRRD